MIKHWNRLMREAMESPALEIDENWLAMVLSGQL